MCTSGGTLWCWHMEARVEEKNQKKMSLGLWTLASVESGPWHMGPVLNPCMVQWQHS
jgi:hypothetical protein